MAVAAAAAVENVVAAEGAEGTGGVAVGSAEGTEAGEPGAGGVVGLGSGAAVDGVGEAGVGVGAAVEAEPAVDPAVGAGAASVPGEAAWGVGGQVNGGCDAGDRGNHEAGWPLWMPPFSSWCFPRSGYLSSRPQRIWSSQHSGTGHERNLYLPHCLSGQSD